MENKKIFFTENELHSLREIRRISRDKSITDLSKLQERLKERGIKVKFEVNKRDGSIKNISFEERTLKMDSAIGKERDFSKQIVGQVDKNREEMLEKMNSPKMQNDRFEEIRRTREERTKMEQKSMYNNKGLER